MADSTLPHRSTLAAKPGQTTIGTTYELQIDPLHRLEVGRSVGYRRSGRERPPIFFRAVAAYRWLTSPDHSKLADRQALRKLDQWAQPSVES